jgi:hypothetical protein
LVTKNKEALDKQASCATALRVHELAGVLLWKI